MTRYGVPDDDMPDSQQSQNWGSANERNLDALLSGKTEDIPEPLSSVAAALAALRAAPVSGELAGEERARAVFRAQFPVLVPDAGKQKAETGHGNALEHTLILPSAGAASRRAVRHRRVRPRREPGLSRRPALLLGSAALIVVAVLAIAFTGIIHLPVTLESFGGRSAAAGTAASSAASPGTRGAGGADTAGGASVLPTPDGTPVAPGVTWQEVRSLCQEYYSYRAHRESAAVRADHKSLAQRLGQLAGSRRDILAYCREAFGLPPRGKLPWPAGSGFPSAPATSGSTGSSGSGARWPYGLAVPQFPRQQGASQPTASYWPTSMASVVSPPA